MSIGGQPAGRIEMTLRADVVPKTVEVSDARQRFKPRSGGDSRIETSAPSTLREPATLALGPA